MRNRITAVIVIVAAPAAIYAAGLGAIGARGTENRSLGISRVCGPVVSAKDAAQLRGNPVFLVLGHAYGGQDLTAVISGENRARFGSPKALIGRRLCVSGRMLRFFGTPRMVVDTSAE